MASAQLDPTFGPGGEVMTRALLDDPPVGVERIKGIVHDGLDIVGCGSSNMSSVPASEFAFCLRLEDTGQRVALIDIRPLIAERTYFVDVRQQGGAFYAVGNSCAPPCPMHTTLVCRIVASSNAIDYCTRSDARALKKTVRAAFIGGTLYVLNKEPGYNDLPVQRWYVDEHNPATGLFARRVFTSPDVVPGDSWIVHDFLASSAGFLHIAVYVLPQMCRVVTISPNGTLVGETVDLPSTNECGIVALAEDDAGRILVGGYSGSATANEARATVWRLLPGGLLIDGSFGTGGAMVLPFNGAGSVLTARIVYDGARRFAVFARHLVFPINITNNNNDVVLYRRYSSDGSVDASWNYTGEANLVSVTNLSEDITSSSVDQLLRVSVAGSRNRVFNVDSTLRRDDSLFLRFPSQLGNCTMGGNVCSCPSDTLCTYNSFVLMVQNATTRPASVVGSVAIEPGPIVLASQAPLQTGQVILQSTGSVTIGAGNILSVELGAGDGTRVIVAADGGIVGQFSQHHIAASGCSVSAPQYNGGVLSVTVSGCSTLSLAAIAGIVVGCVVAAVLIGVSIALISRVITNNHTISMATELRQKELDIHTEYKKF